MVGFCVLPYKNSVTKHGRDSHTTIGKISEALLPPSRRTGCCRCELRAVGASASCCSGRRETTYDLDSRFLQRWETTNPVNYKQEPSKVILGVCKVAQRYRNGGAMRRKPDLAPTNK